MKPLLDVLIILDALEKEGSFAAASAKLFKTPSALSYTVHKLENDLNIQLLDRSGHRARFTRTGKMLLEKGREVLHTVRELENRRLNCMKAGRTNWSSVWMIPFPFLFWPRLSTLFINATA